jgi:hypothetical protein
MLTNSLHPTSSTAPDSLSVTVSLPVHPHRRVGHFADGMAQQATLAAARIGSFADGMYATVDTTPATVPADPAVSSRDALAA